RLDARCQKWTKLPSWPGPARILPVVSCQSNGLHNQLYLFSGRLPGKTNTQLHTDGYRYDPWTQSWHRLNPIQVNGGPPLCLMGATAAPTGAAHIWVMGGDRGRIFTQLDSLNRLMMQTPDTAQIAQLTKLRNQLLDQHPGFSPQLLSYYTITDQWSLIDSFPGKLPVTTPAIHTGDRIVLASGEISPGKRSPKVIQLKIASGHQTFGWINILVVGAYFLVLIWVGWHFSKRQLSLEDYFKGGGRIPWWAAGLSIFGTVLSAISFMAIPAKTFATDWSYFVYNMGPFLVAPIIIALFLPFYQRLDITSVYEYLEQRFNVAIRLIGSLAFMAYQLGRIGIVLYLPAIALHTVSGFNIELCILTMGIISVVYTMMGGIEGVVWTDVMQVIVLMGGALLCIVLMISEIDGGFSGVWQIAVENDKFNLIDLRWNWQEPTFGVVLAAAVFSNVVFYGTDQTVVQRYLTATDMAGARRSIWTNAILVVPATIIFFAIGTILFARYSAAPAEVHPALSATDAIFPWFIVSELPPGVSGLLIAGIFAASMSSLSSSMNSVATAYTTDFHRRFSWRGNLLKVAQNSTQVAGLLGTMFAIMMASWDIKSLWDEFLKVVGLFTGGLGGVFVLGFISQKAHGRGALVGLIASMFIQYLVATSHSVHILLFTATGFLSCLIIGYLASLMLPGQPKPLKNLTFRTLDQDPES
ncbi:MAG: sodium/solute symporter, partial [Bacteroidota bacterium]